MSCNFIRVALRFLRHARGEKLWIGKAKDPRAVFQNARDPIIFSIGAAALHRRILEMLNARLFVLA